VPVIRICEVFGLALKAQHRKLKGKSWAVMDFKSMTAEDGKVYKMLCIHLDSLPMWFATIDTRRV
jgi:P22_AR N-terminal domain